MATAKPRGRQKGAKANSYDVSPREIVKAVIQGEADGKTLASIAKELGMPSATLSAKIKIMRDKGVKLPTFGKRFNESMVDELNELIMDLKGEGETEE